MKGVLGYTEDDVVLPISTAKFALPCSMLKRVSLERQLRETGILVRQRNRLLQQVLDLIAHISK